MTGRCDKVDGRNVVVDGSRVVKEAFASPSLAVVPARNAFCSCLCPYQVGKVLLDD